MFTINFEMMKILNQLPNALTLINLTLGTLAIFVLINGRVPTALILIGGCLLADLLDGAIARKLGVASGLGVQLDSLADIVSFGVLPGMMIFDAGAKYGGIPKPELIAIFAALSTASAGLRLARFNIDDRCMAAGANSIGGNIEPFPNWQRCNGPTGLLAGSTDTSEDAGCQQPDDDSWVAPLDMVAGKSYALLVNNFSQTGLGFSIDWGGTGTFQGPKPAFDITAVQAFECDKTIIFDNQSLAPTDSIVSYLWSFGAGANPLYDSTKGPISVIYESFGDKKVALTVLSSKGCVVTEILDFYIEPCCADTSTLDVTAIITDQVCPGTPTAVIQGVGISGAPDYQFSLDCVNFQPATVFPFLLPGSYTLCIQDEKGCQNQVDVNILPASGFGVELGDTIFVQLGQTADLHAMPFPNLPSNVFWNNVDNLTFNGTDVNSLLNPTALPKHTGWYTVTITTDEGCITTDSVLIVVDAYKPIYIPNVITANNDDLNDRLTVYGNNAATGVDLFQIFDRWGGLMWEGRNFALNDPSLGWDGTCKNEPVTTGVYTYRAQVMFLDDIPLVFTGTVTVLR